MISALGTGLETNWNRMLNGESGIDTIKSFDPTGIASTIAGEADSFNVLDFMPKIEAKKMDRFSQLGLVATGEALDHAGLKDLSLDPDRVGCILGTGIGGIHTFEEQNAILLNRGPSRVSPFMIPKMMPNSLAGLISIKYGYTGPSYVTSSACASAGTALGMALSSIRGGETDIVISGGAESTVTPFTMSGFASMKALSTRNDDPQRASRPFDKDRDGFVLSEGAGIIILEEYEHAKKRGADIYAELKGYASTADAYHITAPKEDGEGPMKAIHLALKDAGVDPASIDYVNAHGTSTPYNDAIETTALKRAFGDHAGRLQISSTKSMLGHVLGGSAAVEMIAMVLTIKRGIIHPTINLETPDPACDLDYVPGSARECEVKNAISNSLGFGGHNVTIVAGAL